MSTLNTIVKAVKQLKEVTSSVGLSQNGGNHWNATGGTGICSDCM